VRKAELLIAGGATAAALGALVATAVPAGESGHRSLADRIPPVEVRTEVVRRTINIYRREHPHVAGAAPGVRGPVVSHGSPASGVASSRTSGHASSAVPGAEAPPPVRARSSGVSSHPETGRNTGASPPRTRSSGAPGGASSGGASKPARTRTSGRHGDDGGGHDD
jgi:hypothetical protein